MYVMQYNIFIYSHHFRSQDLYILELEFLLFDKHLLLSPVP